MKGYLLPYLIFLSGRVVHLFLFYIMYPILLCLNHSPYCCLCGLFHISLPHLVPSMYTSMYLLSPLVKKTKKTLALLRGHTMRPQTFL